MSRIVESLYGKYGLNEAAFTPDQGHDEVNAILRKFGQGYELSEEDIKVLEKYDFYYYPDDNVIEVDDDAWIEPAEITYMIDTYGKNYDFYYDLKLEESLEKHQKKSYRVDESLNENFIDDVFACMYDRKSKYMNWDVPDVLKKLSKSFGPRVYDVFSLNYTDESGVLGEPGKTYTFRELIEAAKDKYGDVTAEELLDKIGPYITPYGAKNKTSSIRQSRRTPIQGIEVDESLNESKLKEAKQHTDYMGKLLTSISDYIDANIEQLNGVVSEDGNTIQISDNDGNSETYSLRVNFIPVYTLSSPTAGDIYKYTTGKPVAHVDNKQAVADIIDMIRENFGE